jgi:hypothetical protein
MEITVRMKCLACNKTMTSLIFATFLGVRFGKWLGESVAQSLVGMVMGYIFGLKGLPDNMLAAAANELHFECPQCKKPTCWEGAPLDEASSTQKVLIQDNADDSVIL